MYNRFLLIVVFVPLAVILIALAVANRGLSAFTLDPFNPGNPALTVELPLFVLLFAALAIGLIVGSAATWLKQGRYRKLARQRSQEAQILRQSAQRATARPVSSTQALTKQST
jgi:uncharacterized integral membrane protein